MSKVLVFAYGVISYLVFFVTYLYAVGFVGNLVVPKSLDSAPAAPLGTALLINLGLLGLFAIQHSVMARPAFKRLLLSRAAAGRRAQHVRAGQQPCADPAVLAVEPSRRRGLGRPGLHGASRALCVVRLRVRLLVLVATFLINHFDLFGLRQVWLYLRGREYQPLPFVTPGPYRLIRHPLYLGWLFAFWATPTMTLTHLLFAVMTTGYIFVAIRFEEQDLIDAHPEYAEYKRRVPMIVPVLAKRAPGAVRTASTIGVLVLMCAWPSAPARPGALPCGIDAQTEGAPMRSSRPCGKRPSGSRTSQCRERGVSPPVRLRQRRRTTVRWAFTT